MSIKEAVQLSFLDVSNIRESFAQSKGMERGAVFTKPEVVDFILDLTNYTEDAPLPRFKLLEPSFGGGDFLLPAVGRLLRTYGRYSPGWSTVFEDLRNSVRAVEIDKTDFSETSEKLIQFLRSRGVSQGDALRLKDAWLIEGDFLLTEFNEEFTHIVGNPPYVRQELVPDDLMAEYRSRFFTIYDRADLYIPFMEHCLDNLEEKGTLGFICSDRWMKNKYGRELRGLIAERFHLKVYVDMVDTPAFRSEVIAYPAITVIRKESPGSTRIAYRPRIDRGELARLSESLVGEGPLARNGVVESAIVAKNKEPWILQSFHRLEVVRRLEREFPLLEESGCKVGIGVATGADKVFIGPFEQLPVEPDRKLRLATTRDIAGGTVSWNGLGVINPFRDDGSLAQLREYPKLEEYFNEHAEIVRKRNCAKKNPNRWYRTIDRIYPELAGRPKLLVPDIKGKANIVFENGRYYPHHNLYYIVSDQWDLKALRIVLLSGIAELFISAYSTRMRGGYLRFQAQYLRKIRLPRWENVPVKIKKELLSAAEFGDLKSGSRAAFNLFRLTPEEQSAIFNLES